MADTEIDWEAYMEQASQYLNGERDYTMIKGGTGPLVYPAFHVYIYSVLYKLTDEGKNIFLAQAIFAWWYMAILMLVMACYRKARVRPPYCGCVCMIDPVADVVPRVIGSTLPLSSPCTFEANAQHLPPATFQRLFRCSFLFIAIYAYQHRI